jgi:hypothetical protein
VARRSWTKFILPIALLALGVVLSFLHPAGGLIPLAAVSTTYDIPAATAALKELYKGQTVQNLVYKDNPFLAMVPKMEDFVGKNYPIPIQFGVSQGRSATFSNAQANITAAQLQEFVLTRKKDYSIARLDNETMLASAQDIGSFVKGAKVVVDSAIRGSKLSLASALFRAGTGSVAQISSISTGVITLTNVGDVVHFEINMTLQSAATDGAAPRAAKGYVISLDRNLGTVTVASSGLGGVAATPGSWAANDFLLQDGDSNAKVSGLSAWCPQSAPSATLFYGVDRTQDILRLGGIRFDGSGYSIEEAQIQATQLAGREGANPTIGVMPFSSFAALQAALGSKVTYAEYKGPANIAFRGITVNGANGSIDVFPDRSCQAATEYLLQLDTWTLATLGPAPRILEYEDGALMMRSSTADEMEVRVGLYGNLGCNAPGWNVNVKLAA